MNGGENPELLGLSYNKEKRWEQLCGGQATPEQSTVWKPETTYQVAIVLQNSTQGYAYVDGQRVGNEQCALEITDLRNISHFYIGGDGDSADNTGRKEVSVTVENVLLYNRPLNGNEITALNPNKVTVSMSEETVLQSPVTLQS
ncbi:trans-sialidase, putative, partial [Trypanosoma cruzi marinkellei]